MILIKLIKSFFSIGDLYFGDNQFGNQIVPMGLGGAGGGLLYLHSRHVDIDGEVSANGLAPDSRHDTGAGELILNLCILVEF